MSTLIHLPHNDWDADKAERFGPRHGPHARATADFLALVLQEQPILHHLSHLDYTLPVRAGSGVLPTGLLFQAANHCYDQHLPFGLAPEVVWLTILAEVATTVKENAAHYASLYTSTPDARERIEVYVDHFVYGQPNDWTAGISQFDSMLRPRVPTVIADRSLLRFSTSTPVSNVACLIAFMDAASPFFDFQMRTRCGIPLVRLEGTAADWRSIVDGATFLAEAFGQHLGGYFAELVPVLEKLARTAEGGPIDISFWDSMYKLANDSGGPYVSGWLTTLLAYEGGQDGKKRLRKRFDRACLPNSEHHARLTTHAMPSQVAVVPFVWKYLDTAIPMRFVTGVLGVEFDGEVYAPRVGFAVIEGAG
jgi:hypothetical protein